MSKVSVIIPNWNRAWYLAYSLMHYTRQTMKDFEIIVVDDGSSDNVVDVCRSFKNKLDIQLYRSNRKSKEVGVDKNRSAGPLINFAVRHVAKADIILYSDCEVVPFRDFVENHYLSHQLNHVFEMGDTFITNLPYKLDDIDTRITVKRLVVENEFNIVQGLTTKTWKEHADVFGTLEQWHGSGMLMDIEMFHRIYWDVIFKAYGKESFPFGKQDYWGFQGSQAGLSFRKDMFLAVGGWSEDLDIPGIWMGEDGELYGRMEKYGAKFLYNWNIKAVHLYHAKAPVYSDEMRKEFIENRNADMTLTKANEGIEWGCPNKLYIEKVEL